MSILIKGMEMPTSCRACMFSRTDIRNVDWCVLTEKDLPCDCPIIPVQGHGGLIDADVLFDLILNIYKNAQGEARKAYSDVLDVIVATDDVIPADPAEEGDNG